MSALGTKEQYQLDVDETKEAYHFEWTIPSFNHLIERVESVEKAFFPPERDSKYEWFFKVHKDRLNFVFFTLYATESMEKYVVVDRSLCLKSLDDVYKLPFEKNFVDSSHLLSFSLRMSELEEQMKLEVSNRPQDLTIICEVSIADSLNELRKKKERRCIDDKDISDHRNSVLNDDSFKDFSFVVQDQTFHVSKFLLALESPVFAAMFKTKMSEGLNSKAIITDTEPEIFMKMIQFIYHQKVDQTDLEKSAPQLLKIAHMYDVKKLKRICVNFLYGNLSVDNALETLLLSDLYSISELEKKAFRFIKLNIKLFKESEDFKNFIKEKPNLALKLIKDKGEVSDDYLYHFLGKTKLVGITFC